nr:hypothetical protein [Tanacetum cinerariifolium]
MRTRSSFNLHVVSHPNPSTSNPKCHNRRHSKQPFILEESPVDTMADQRTMAELLRVPTEGYAEAIVVLPILAEQFELKHSLINMMTSDQFLGLEKDNPHDHIRWGSPSMARKRTPAYKDLHRACPHHGFTELHQLDTFYNALNPTDQDSLNSAASGNLLERRTQDVLTIIENKSKVHNSRNKLVVSQFQATPPPASVKAIEKICVTCGGAHPYYQCLVTSGNTFLKLRDNIQGYVAAAAVITIRVIPFIVLQFHINITLANALILIPKYQKMLKALLSNKEKLQELANTPLNENCSAVILKKLLEKLGDPGKFLILYGFNELKCKVLADLGSSQLDATLCLEEVRDVFVPVGKFTFPANFVIVDYESDPRVLLILGRHFLRTARALIDVHGEEMILHDGDERLTLNMRHGTLSYSNQPQKESINLNNVFNDSCEVFLENLFSTNQPSGNPTFSSHPILTSPEVKDDIFNPEGGNVLPEKLLDFDSTKDLHPPLHVNPLSGSTTYSSSPNQLPEMFTDEHALDYSSPSLFDEYDDDLFEVESDTKNDYDDPFDSKGEKIKESKLLIDELDLPCDFLLPFEYDSILSEDFSKVDALPSTN